MVKVCAACGELKEAELHTANGWICLVCVRSASTITVTYIINGKNYHKLLKSQKTETTPAKSLAGVVSIRKDNR